MKRIFLTLLLLLAFVLLAQAGDYYGPDLQSGTQDINAASITGDSVTTTAADGSRKLTMDNNSAIAPTASENAIYMEGAVLKIEQNGTESAAVLSPTAGQVTLTGPTAIRSYAIADRAGRIHSSGAALTTLTPGAAVALDVTLNDTYKLTVTDNEDSTITFSAAGSVGQVIKIIFVTAGAADDVVTFHATLVSSTGTLTLGTTAGKFYVVSFISDGTHWYEVSRTAVQT